MTEDPIKPRRQRRLPSADEMLQRLASLCAQSEQCEHDLRQKLNRAGISSEDADWIIRQLREGRFLDETRYARAFARDKSRFSGWGPRKIAAGLAAKRVPSAIVREALAELAAEDTAENAFKAAKQKARSLDLADRADCARLLRHLASRGFSSGDCYRALDRLRDETDG